MIEAKHSPIQQAWDNFDAWWRFRGCDAPAPIHDSANLWISEDRIWYPREKPLMESIDRLWVSGHLKKAGAKNHGVQVEAGYRESENPSAQIVVHRFCVEMDFDMFSPVRDLASVILHLGEVIRPGATDPFKVAEGLRERGIFK